jgi:peptide/nickel transport system permease protein
MAQGQYLIRRLILMIPVLIGVTIISFVLIHLIPGDPAQVILGVHAQPENLAAMRHQLGLDRPLWRQYTLYLGDVLKLDLGDSIKFQQSVDSLLQKRIGVTLFLVGFSTLLTIVIAFPLGIIAALKKNSLFDQILRAVLMVTMVMPAFWVGILLLILFGVKLDLLPVSGYGDGFFGHVSHMFLPSLTIALSLSPILVRSLRSSILQSMSSDYVRTARAKGLGERNVLSAHVLKNALIPSITLLGLSVGYLMGSTVIVERVFSLPGVGSLLVDSISARDYPVVQAITLVFAVFVILVNVATDLVYTYLDPRVQLS